MESLGKEDQAQKLFQEQVDKLKSVEDSENTGKTVAFFYINSMGAANVRKSNDYVSKMIELAGGEYISMILQKTIMRCLP